MPSYFAKNSYENPTNPMDGPFQYSQGQGHAFAWLNQRPDLLEAFQAYIYAQCTERPSWVDEGFYPVHDRLIEDMETEGESFALVDVGGGVEYCLEEFRAKFTEWKGRLVLQEQEIVANSVLGLNKAIEVMAYDFFTPQPIKGARVYFPRNILHDWPDDRSRDILNHLKSVMKPGYSKILLNECVVADEGASWQHTSLDMYMMALASGQERTESQWRNLIFSVGLQVAGIWIKGKGNESIIEVVN